MSEQTVIVKQVTEIREWKKIRRYKEGAEYYGMSLSMFHEIDSG